MLDKVVGITRTTNNQVLDTTGDLAESVLIEGSFVTGVHPQSPVFISDHHFVGSLRVVPVPFLQQIPRYT